MAKTGGISGVAVAGAAAGGLLVYAGLRDVNPLQALRDVLSGAPPPVLAGSGLPHVTGNTVAGAVPGTEAGRIVASARQYLGVPYRWGGASPSAGFDCSGLVTWVLHHDVGLNLPSNTHTVTGQFLVWSGATTVPASSRQAGDLVCWANHIAICTGPSTMIEAPGAGGAVRETRLRTAGAVFRRVKNQSVSTTDVPNTRLGGTAF